MSTVDDSRQMFVAQKCFSLSTESNIYRSANEHRSTSYKDASGLHLALIDGAPLHPELSKQRSLQLVAKRYLLDLPLAVLALVALSPLLVLIAVCIRAQSPGPVLFGQVREGLGGSRFRLWKFRTMRLAECDYSGQAQTTFNDKRLTRIGRFLRATSLDELPQLWNVVVGEMSIIGPRPMIPEQMAAGQDYRVLVPYYDFRLLVRPGLSGWAQANGLRGPTTERDPAVSRIEHDCAYIQRFSLLLDLRIIWKTISQEFITGSGV